MKARILPKYLFFVTLFFPSFVSVAGGWTGPVTITDVYIWNSDYINVRVSPYVNIENCSDTQGYQIVFNGLTDTFQSRMLMMIEMAKATNQPLSFYLNGCGNKAIINAISFGQPRG